MSSEENEQIFRNLYKVWSRACLAFNEEEANFAINKALEISTPELVCTQVIQKGLAGIGKGWYAVKAERPTRTLRFCTCDSPFE